jgi:formylglycine-generating enzyme required for sulfatase activity
MTGFRRHGAMKLTAVLLCLLLIPVNLPPHTRDNKNKLEIPFNWAKKHYLDGKYRVSAATLELLLSFLDETDKELTGRIWLLLGAANEKMGKLVTARDYYKKAKKIAGKPVIREIDLSNLVEYQRIIMDNTKPLMEKVIEREAHRPKKKQASFLLVAALVAVAAAIVAVLIINKRKTPPIIANPSGDPDFDTRELGIEWVRVPAGQFSMGDNFREGESDEEPVHPVHLDEYYISKYEITHDQYEKFAEAMSQNWPSDEGWGRGNRPVINVSYSQARLFCEWLSVKTGKNIQLPTEAQWEKAARSTDQRRYPWGDGPLDCSHANYCCGDRTRPVGSYPAGATPSGIHDMAGNAAEWCRDWYDPNFYFESRYNNPQGPTSGLGGGFLRVVRGGSWNCKSPLTARSADRHGLPADVSQQHPFNTFNDVGFRIVWEID